MKFEQKLVRALKNGKKTISAMNGGAFKMMRVAFSFSEEGNVQNYTLQIIYSPEEFSLINYGSRDNETVLWKQQSAGAGVSIGLFDVAEFKEEVKRLEEEIANSYTPSEKVQVLTEYLKGAEAMQENFAVA